MPNQDNTNLALPDGATYLNSPVQKISGLFNTKYQHRRRQALVEALEQYPLVYAVRCVLYFPAEQRENHFMSDDDIITHFVESFKAQLLWDLSRALRRTLYRQECCVWFACTKEEQFDQTAFDVTILLNHSVVFELGDLMTERNNMFKRLTGAWANTVGLPVTSGNGLVHLPRNPDHHIRHDDAESIADFIKSISPI